MRRVRVLFALCSLLTVGGAPPVGGTPPVPAPGPGATMARPPDVVAGQLLLGFDPASDRAAREAIVAARGGRILGHLDGIGAAVVAPAPGRPLGEEARAYAAAPGVRYAEPHYRARAGGVPNDPRYRDDPNDAARWGLEKIGAPTAWETTTGGEEVVVGVVDTGVDYTHPDLEANIWSAPAGWSVRGCRPGTHGYRSIGGDTSCDPRDDQDHGSHVAGTIGAVGDNGIGVVGVNWRVRIMALKCLNSAGFVRIADAVNVLDYAVAAKAAGANLRVLTIGWVAESHSQALLDAINRASAAGILIVAAAGDTGGDNDLTPRYPASYGSAPYNVPHLLAVTATNRADGRVGNFGWRSVHLAAPGGGILSTVRATSDDGYGGLSGSPTSSAAAYVGGAAALVLAAPGMAGLPARDLRARLLACGDKLQGWETLTTSGRRLNVARAVANADCSYALTVYSPANSANAVITSPDGGEYPAGTQVTLTAVPGEAFSFAGWRLDDVAIGAENPLVVTMDPDHVVEALFGPRIVTLDLDVSGGGRVTVEPPGPAYPFGTEVALVARPIDGNRFAGWTLDDRPVGDTATLTLPMTGDRAVVARFAPLPAPSPSPSPSPSPTPSPSPSPSPGPGASPSPGPSPSPPPAYTIALAPAVGGTISAAPGPGPHVAGSRVSLAALPDAGFLLAGWTIDGAAMGRANPHTLVVSRDHQIAATFVRAHALELSHTSGGNVAVSAPGWAGGSPYPAGTALTLTAATTSNGVFTGWVVDGVFAGWAATLPLTMDGPHTVVANFAPRPRFGDLPPGPPPYEAVAQLAARGVILGYANGDFGPDDTILRAQMAALIARALGWDGEERGNAFTDRCLPEDPDNCVDDDLWRAVGALAFHQVARGYGDGTYGARDPVLHVQTIAFIARAMVRQGYWTARPDDPALGPNIPASSGHREDIATYIHHAGPIPGIAPTADWPAWDAPATRGWFAQALWQALDSYFGGGRTP